MSSPFAHASIALFSKRFVKSIPLWILVLATQIPDILFFLFNILGIEIKANTTQDIHNGIQYLSPAYMPWSHGLFMCLLWSMLIMAIVFIFSKKLIESAIVGGMVLSHWILDSIMYSNLPLFFDNSILIGLGIATSGKGFLIGIMLEIVLIFGSMAFMLFTRKR